MILPIYFQKSYKKSELKGVTKEDILSLLEQYLEYREFNYIIRKKDKIVFHSASLLITMKPKDFLMSGIVKVIEKEEKFVIKNGNWLVFLIAVPFILIYALFNSKYSTFDAEDKEIFRNFFIVLFLGNLVIRYFSHYEFKLKIKELIEQYLIND